MTLFLGRRVKRHCRILLASVKHFLAVIILDQIRVCVFIADQIAQIVRIIEDKIVNGLKLGWFVKRR